MLESKRHVANCRPTNHAEIATTATSTTRAIRRVHSLRRKSPIPSAIATTLPGAKKSCIASGMPRDPVNGGSRIVKYDSAEIYAHCTSGLAIRSAASSETPRLRTTARSLTGIPDHCTGNPPS